jgi:hypothetical protein
MDERPNVDWLTVAGLALLLMPLLTMLHEIGGHGAACLASGGRIEELGAFYVDCDDAGDLARRLGAFAGPAIDIVGALIGFAVWRKLRGDLARLAGWYVWLCCAFAAAGYFLFSGVTGIGDLGPQGTAGIGPLPAPWIWRAVFALGGGFAYFLLVKLGMRTLGEMIGQGPATRTARRTIAHGFYAVLCVAAVAASIPNPIGLFITLASATASSFGGNAGLISIGFATRDGEAKAFRIERSWLLLVTGAAVVLAFALVLGPTLRFS